MIKKRIGIILATGVVILAGVAYAVGSYIDLSKSNNKLSQMLAESEVRIVTMEDSIKLLEEENLNIKNENELLRVELSDLQEQYEELNGKYQKEISPVSFQD